MNAFQIPLVFYVTVGVLTALLLVIGHSIRQLRSRIGALERALTESRAENASERSLVDSRIIALERRTDVDQLYFEHLDRLIGKRLYESSDEALDRLYTAIDVRLLECARGAWHEQFTDTIRQRLAETLLEELRRQASDLDPRIKEALVSSLVSEAQRFVGEWVHRSYDKLTGNARAFADSVWNQIGSQAYALDPMITDRIVEQLTEEAGRFSKAWLQRNYSDLVGNGKAFADAVWAEIGRQGQTLDPSVIGAVVTQLATISASFVESWIKRPYEKLEGNGKVFANAVWQEVRAISDPLPSQIRDAITDELGRNAAHLVAEGLRLGTEGCPREITELIWAKALASARDPDGNVRAAIDSALSQHVRNSGALG